MFGENGLAVPYACSPAYVERKVADSLKLCSTLLPKELAENGFALNIARDGECVSCKFFLSCIENQKWIQNRFKKKK